ncbi:MAG: cell division topological specificity factor MinE [Dorea sp.]|jgi:cell division topological specificity factor|nr:cell division topological specificity factor MinE [Dorea sp.]
MIKRSSVRIAKERLEALVTSDRVHCKPKEYDLICHELYRTLSKYMEITKEDFQVCITRSAIHIQLTGEEH